MTRDAVRMLVAHRATGEIEHSTFTMLPTFLDPGDVVVVNTSATIPAAVDAVAADGTSLVVHLSTQVTADRWVIELRRPTPRGTARWPGPLPRSPLSLGEAATASIEAPYGTAGRLWLARLRCPNVHWPGWPPGRPIRYGYAEQPWPLSAYQNVYALEPGSAEMPSAGRPFTPEVITRLVAKGVGVSPIVLHTGVASLEADELPYPERAGPGRHRRAGERRSPPRSPGDRRGHDGRPGPRDGSRRGRRRLVLRRLDRSGHHARTRRARRRRAADRLARARGVASAHARGRRRPRALRRSYDAGLAGGYLWHEFGDVHLILP